MLDDEQLIERLRDGFAAQVAGLHPPQDLTEVLEGELRRSRRRRLPRVRRGPVSGVVAVGVVVAVILFAVLNVHPSSTPNGNAGRSPAAAPALPVGSSRLVTTTSDPRGAGRWGLQEFRIGEHRACLLVGRVHDKRLGVLGRDGAYRNDARLHPLSAREFSHCGKTDADGHLFLDVSLNAVPVSGAQGGRLTSCTVHGEPFANGSQTYCPPRDLRAIFFGTVGPDATRVTYSVNGRTGSARTGPQGSYLIVVSTGGHTCTPSGFGGGTEGSCVDSPSAATAHGLRPGAITSVTYRNGSTCTLTSSSGTLVNRVCPNVGYAHYPPRSIPKITAQQAKASLHVTHVLTDHICYETGVRGVAPEIACDHNVPAGYKRQQPGVSQPALLISVRFTAPLTATNHHSVYEYSIGKVSGPFCTNSGGSDGTTMKPVPKGSNVLIQDQGGVCSGTWKGIVSYQPNGHPGADTLTVNAPIRDGSTIVGRFSFKLR